MKKQILLILIGLVSFALFTGAYIIKTGINDKEDGINISVDSVTIPIGLTYEKKATDSIFIFNPTTGKSVSVESTFFKISLTDLQTLRDKADTLGNGVTGSYITAFEILYGINSSFIMDIYIRPLYLVTSTGGTNGAVYTYTATPTSFSQTNIYYMVGTSGIQPDVTGQHLIDSANYQNYIRISHNSTDATKKFILGTDITSIVYPFQEIDTLVKVNPGTSTINLFNIGVDKGLPSMLKHDIMLAPPSVQDSLKGFPGKEYADLANMCPPECPNVEIIYTIAVKY